MTASLGTLIRTAREDAGLTREAMSPHIGVTLRTLARWERDETENIPMLKMIDVARVTGKPLSFFLNGDSEVAA